MRHEQKGYANNLKQLQLIKAIWGYGVPKGLDGFVQAVRKAPSLKNSLREQHSDCADTLGPRQADRTATCGQLNKRTAIQETGQEAIKMSVHTISCGYYERFEAYRGPQENGVGRGGGGTVGHSEETASGC